MRVAEVLRDSSGDDERALRFASAYLEHEMPNAGAEKMEEAALKFLAELQGRE